MASSDDSITAACLYRASSAFFLSVMSSTIASTSGDGLLFNKDMLKLPQTKEPSRRKKRFSRWQSSIEPAPNCGKSAQSFSASSRGEKSTQCLLRNSSSLKPRNEQKDGLKKTGRPSKFSTSTPMGLALKTSWKS